MVAAGKKNIVTVAITFIDWLSAFNIWLSCWLTVLNACSRMSRQFPTCCGEKLTRLVIFWALVSKLWICSLQLSRSVSLCWIKACTPSPISLLLSCLLSSNMIRWASATSQAVECAALELSFRCKTCFAMLYMATKLKDVPAAPVPAFSRTLYAVSVLSG